MKAYRIMSKSGLNANTFKVYTSIKDAALCAREFPFNLNVLLFPSKVLLIGYNLKKFRPPNIIVCGIRPVFIKEYENLFDLLLDNGIEVSLESI